MSFFGQEEKTTMKASLTFREEKSPLIRMKFPLSLAGFPLASGIVIGDNVDLALHVGTPPEAFPSVKIAYQPNLPASPLSMIIKAGIGPWGPPGLAALSVSMELRFSRVSSSPFFTMHVKPRLGNFSFRKMVKPVSLGLSAEAHKNVEESHNHSRSQSRRCRQSHSDSLSHPGSHMTMPPDENSRQSDYNDTDAGNEALAGSSRGIFYDSDAGNKSLLHGVFDDRPAITPLKLDKSSLITPMPFCSRSFHKMHTSISAATEPVVNWGSDYLKIDEFDHSNRRSHDDDIDLGNRKRHEEQTRSFNNFKDHHSGLGSPLSASIGGESCLNEPETDSAIRSSASFPLPWCLGVDESIKGWSLHAHSSLPLGAQTTLKVRWGVNAHYNPLQEWESQFSSVKLPYLYLQKINLMTTVPTMESCNRGDFSKGGQLQLLPRDGEVHELSPVAALCGSMKHQLQLLYTENQVLKKAMEEMKTQFEYRSSVGDVLAEKQIGAGAKLLDNPPEKESSKERKDVFEKDQQEKGSKVAEKSRWSYAHRSLDALRKLGSLGRCNGRSTSQRSLLD